MVYARFVQVHQMAEANGFISITTIKVARCEAFSVIAAIQRLVTRKKASLI